MSEIKGGTSEEKYKRGSESTSVGGEQENPNKKRKSQDVFIEQEVKENKDGSGLTDAGLTERVDSVTQRNDSGVQNVVEYKEKAEKHVGSPADIGTNTMSGTISQPEGSNITRQGNSEFSTLNNAASMGARDESSGLRNSLNHQANATYGTTNPLTPINRMPEYKPNLGNSGVRKTAYMNNMQPVSNTNTTSGRDKADADDPSKLNDALSAAGVDIQHEEDLLSQQPAQRPYIYGYSQPTYQQMLYPQQYQRYTPRTTQSTFYLSPHTVASYMQRVARENGIFQNFSQDPELIELMMASCESWLSNIITRTLVLSRHRRRNVPAFNPHGRRLASSSYQKSEISKELRGLAIKQRDLEEKRVSRRVALGLEKNEDENSNGANSKAGAEETMHRAANATAAMMAMHPGRKKYSWMSLGDSGSSGGAGSDDSKNKVSSIISVRGDNGLRFREIKTGNSVTMKDLLAALENEKIGVEKALIKGYSRLKD